MVCEVSAPVETYNGEGLGTTLSELWEYGDRSRQAPREENITGSALAHGEGALSEVNWYEIATSLLQDAEVEQATA